MYEAIIKEKKQAGASIFTKVYRKKEEDISRRKAEKKNALEKLKVTISTGKVFYADSESRIDLSDAIKAGEEKGLTETNWKLAEAIEGLETVGREERVYVVTIDELREARDLALASKGSIVGAI